MPFIEAGDPDGEFLDPNDGTSDAEENEPIYLPDPYKAVVIYHGTDFTLTSTSSYQSEIELPKLSQRENEVLQHLANGFSPEQIALRLGIKVRTVRKYLANLVLKFNTCSRDQLMARAGYLKLCNPYNASSTGDRANNN
jgi:DNA-binding CsgD family transcriptional regulator